LGTFGVFIGAQEKHSQIVVDLTRIFRREFEATIQKNNSFGLEMKCSVPEPLSRIKLDIFGFIHNEGKRKAGLLENKKLKSTEICIGKSDYQFQKNFSNESLHRI